MVSLLLLIISMIGYIIMSRFYSPRKSLALSLLLFVVLSIATFVAFINIDWY